MSVKEEIIFEPAYTPNQNWIKELDSRHMDSSFSSLEHQKMTQGLLLYVSLLLSSQKILTALQLHCLWV